MLLGQDIKRFRKQKGLNQQDLAHLAGLSVRPIYLLESGKGNVRLETLIAICNALGLTIQLTPKGRL